MKPNSKYSRQTKMLHVGREPSEQFGFVNTPIYRGSTVLFPTYQALQERKQRFIYGTHGNPTTESLQTAWTELSGAAGTVMVSSGLMAVVIALQAVLKAGDHLLMVDSVYRPTRNFCEGFLKKFGVETQYYDPLLSAVEIAKLFRPNTTAIFTEAPGSQSFEMQDIPALAKVAHKHDICVLMDNTWATPLFFPPHERGVDIAIEAGTKYLSGHSDLLLGLVTANEKYFPALKQMFDITSPCITGEDAFLALRGLRTMNLRVKEAEKQGLALAKWLEARKEVKQVLHPALPSHPQHAIWKRDFTGSTGLFSVILHPISEKQLAAFLDGLELFGMGYSWGGFESLCVPFDCAPYRTATKWQPEGVGLRFQIGFEALEDLYSDLEAGFERMKL